MLKPTARNLAILSLLLAAAGCSLAPDAVPMAMPWKNEAVVFDIDGTLTPDVRSINTARENAAEAVTAFASADIKIVYLTARTPLLQSRIPGWLAENGFPNGYLHVLETAEDKEDHARYKLRVLKKYRALGWKFVAAYGDSSTDFVAYAKVGIPQERIFALQRRGEESCQPGPWSACFEGWTEQLDDIARLIGTLN